MDIFESLLNELTMLFLNVHGVNGVSVMCV